MKKIVKISLQLLVFSDRFFERSHGGVGGGGGERLVHWGGADGEGGGGAIVAWGGQQWALHVYPVFEDEKSKPSDEKSAKHKIALKKDRQD